MKACELLTKEKMASHHCYLGWIKGKQMICAESLSEEKGEEKIMAIVEKNGGCVSRNALIRQMALPIGVCDDLIGVREGRGSET